LGCGSFFSFLSLRQLGGLVVLLSSMNPCPCGYHGVPSGQGENRRECNCVSQLIQKYRAKISGPLLDRIDIHFTVPAVAYEKLAEAR